MVKCLMHPNSPSYMDPDTQTMRCWGCYCENKFHTYIGKPILTYGSKDGNYQMKMLIVAEHEVHIVGWHKTRDNNFKIIREPIRYQYLSQASRDWKRFAKEIDTTNKLNFRGR